LLLQVGAQTWLSWVQEGLLLDDRTRGLTARLVTYNAELKVFADIQVAFDFQAGGSIKVRRGCSCASDGQYAGIAAVDAGSLCITVYWVQLLLKSRTSCVCEGGRYDICCTSMDCLAVEVTEMIHSSLDR
jgi:hypothetical protein